MSTTTQFAGFIAAVTAETDVKAGSVIGTCKSSHRGVLPGSDRINQLNPSRRTTVAASASPRYTLRIYTNGWDASLVLSCGVSETVSYAPQQDCRLFLPQNCREAQSGRIKRSGKVGVVSA
jgi:hypothetical protein